MLRVVFPGGPYEKKTPVTPLFPCGLSLECTEGDQQSDLIEFTFDGRMWMRDIDLRNYPGGGTDSAPIPLYHSHVLWSYILRHQVQLDGSIALSLRGCGPHIGCNVTDVFSVRNHPKGLTEPDLLAATGTFVDANGEEKETIEFALDAAGHWTATKRFTRDELAARAGADGDTICILIRFVAARSYFTLSKLLNEPIIVSKEASPIVERILRGEKTAGCDWAITVGSYDGDGDIPRTYHVHSAMFSRISDHFEEAVQTGRSIGDLIVMNRPNACTIPSLAPDYMPVLLSIAYGIDVPLPTNIDTIAKMGRALKGLINWYYIEFVMFPHWEMAICKEVLALDKHALSSFAALPRLLLTVWCAPYGALPTAKRVVIGVFADMVWLQTPPGKGIMRFMYDTVIPAIRAKQSVVGTLEIAYTSMLMHIEIVSAVRKVGLSTKKKVDGNKEGNDVEEKKVNEDNDVEKKKEEGVDDALGSVPAVPAKPDLEAPTVVPIDDDGVAEPANESAKWQCTIS